MAWPDVSTLIDNFERGSLGANWTTGSFFGDAALTISASTLLTSSTTNFGGGYYNAATYGPDIDLIVDAPTIGTSGLIFRCSADNSPVSAYEYMLLGVTSHIDRIDNGTGTQLGATFSVGETNGDKIGVEMIASTIKAYRFTGGAWGASLASRGDATYSGAGQFALEIVNNSFTLDNMSGGTVGAAAATAQRPFLQPMGIYH